MGERMIDQDRPSMIWGFPFFRRTKFYHKAWSLWSKYIYLRVCCPSGEWWNYGNMDVGHEHHHHHHHQYLYLYLYLRISIRIYISINHRHPHLHPHPHPIHVSSLQSSELLYQKKTPQGLQTTSSSRSSRLGTGWTQWLRSTTEATHISKDRGLENWSHQSIWWLFDPNGCCQIIFQKKTL